MYLAIRGKNYESTFQSVPVFLMRSVWKLSLLVHHYTIFYMDHELLLQCCEGKTLFLQLKKCLAIQPLLTLSWQFWMLESLDHPDYMWARLLHILKL